MSPSTRLRIPSHPAGGIYRARNTVSRAAIRAGRWLFATGQAGTDYVHGLAPEVLQSGHPFDGPSQAHREARRLFRNVDEVLAAGGSNAANVVRVDQYYTSADAVPTYHETRKDYFKGKVPPSTSNLHRRFSRAQQSMEVQVMAAVPGGGFEARHEAAPAPTRSIQAPGTARP